MSCPSLFEQHKDARDLQLFKIFFKKTDQTEPKCGPIFARQTNGQLESAIPDRPTQI